MKESIVNFVHESFVARSLIFLLILIIIVMVIKKFLELKKQIRELEKQLKSLKMKIIQERKYSIKNVDLIEENKNYLERTYTLHRMYQKQIEILQGKIENLVQENKMLKQRIQNFYNLKKRS